MADISGRSLDDDFASGEEVIIRDPSAALNAREHRVRSVPTLTHLTETGNAFSVGDAVGRSGGAWVLADANNDIPALFMVWEIIDANDFMGIREGKMAWTHSKTPLDAQYWLSETAGDITDTKPGAGSIQQRLCYVLTASVVLVNIGDPEE